MQRAHTHLPDPEHDAQFYDGVPPKRLIAWGIDLLAVSCLAVGVSVASFGLLFFIFPIVFFAINLAYRAITISHKSATLGMQLLGIELRNRNGDHLSTSEAFIHTVLFIIAFMSGFGVLANILCIVLSERKQAIHDLLIGTVMINRPEE